MTGWIPARVWARYDGPAVTERERRTFRRVSSWFVLTIVVTVADGTFILWRGTPTSYATFLIATGLALTWACMITVPRRLSAGIQVALGIFCVGVVYGRLMSIPLGRPSMLDCAFLAGIPVIAASAAGVRNARIWTVIVLTADVGVMAAMLTFAGPEAPDPIVLGFVIITLTLAMSLVSVHARRTSDSQLAALADAHADLSAMFAELEVLNSTLETAVAQRTAELADALRSAQAAARAKGTFVANMSHELRTPLNGVLGVTDLLGDTPLDGEQQALLASLRTSGRALQDTLGSILDFSTMESGELGLTDRPFDPAEVVYRAVSDFAPAAHAKGVDLAVACAPDLPDTVSGDALQFGRAIERLVSNAEKFCVAGRIGVFCWFEPDAAHVEAIPDSGVDERSAPNSVANVSGTAGVVCVQVEDTGPGMSMTQLDRLWDAFTAGDDTARKQNAGVGLGLTLVREFARLSGGHVDVSSRPGVGSIFTLRVPTVAQPATPRLLPVTPGRIGVVAGELSGWTTAFMLACAGADAVPVDVTADSDVLAGFDAVVVDRATAEGKAFRVPAGMRCVEVGVAQGVASPPRPDPLMYALAAALPVSDADASADAGATADADDADVPTTVLIVEDNPVNRKVITKMVASLGYDTFVAENGQEGADTYMAHAGEITAVLMDCQMPVLDGFGSTRVIRTFERGGRRCPIIAVTANALEGDRERCLAAGMDDFVAKPVDRARLAAVLHEWAPRNTTVVA